MRQLNIIFGLTLLTTIVSCSKDKGLINPADSVSFEIRLLDSNGNTTTSFTQGNDIVFEVSMKNKSANKIIYYEGLKCAEMKFNVYQNNSIFGHPYPDNLACTEELRQDFLNPHETKKASINWFERQQNQPLPSGNYSATFKTNVAYNEPKGWKEISLSVNFVVN